MDGIGRSRFEQLPMESGSKRYPRMLVTHLFKTGTKTYFIIQSTFLAIYQLLPLSTCTHILKSRYLKRFVVGKAIQSLKSHTWLMVLWTVFSCFMKKLNSNMVGHWCPMPLLIVQQQKMEFQKLRLKIWFHLMTKY